MNSIQVVAAGAAFLVVTAATLAAQDTVPEPQRPPARMRMHAPGTGLRSDVTPMHRRQGGAWRARRADQVGERGYVPRALLAQREFLGLSEAQVAELESLQADAESAREKAAEQTKARQERLAELWKADKPDVAAIGRESQALMEARQDAWLAGVDASARAKAALTAEQLGKVRGLAEGRQMGQRRGMGARRAPGIRPRAGRPGARGFAPRRMPRRP